MSKKKVTIENEEIVEVNPVNTSELLELESVYKFLQERGITSISKLEVLIQQVKDNL